MLIAEFTQMLSRKQGFEAIRAFRGFDRESDGLYGRFQASNGLPKLSDALAHDLAQIHANIAASKVDQFAHVLEMAQTELNKDMSDLVEYDNLFKKLQAKRDAELMNEKILTGASLSTSSIRQRALTYRDHISPYSTCSSTPTIRSPAMEIPSDSSVSKKSKTCPMCNQGFASRQSMLRHITRKHPDYDGTKLTHYDSTNEELSYKCDVCNKSFGKLGSLSYHKKRHETKSLECSQCHRKYTHGSELRKHLIRSHKIPAADVSKNLESYRVADEVSDPSPASDDDDEELLMKEIESLEKAAL